MGMDTHGHAWVTVLWGRNDKKPAYWLRAWST